MNKGKKYWFIPKNYGYGFIPITIEGWLMVLLFLIVIFTDAYANNIFDEQLVTLKGVILFLVDSTLLITVFSLLAVKKTKGELKWYWGDRDNTKSLI